MAKVIAAKKRRTSLTDFERFKVMLLKKRVSFFIYFKLTMLLFFFNTALKLLAQISLLFFINKIYIYILIIIKKIRPLQSFLITFLESYTKINTLFFDKLI